MQNVEVEALSRVLAAVYDAALDPAAWPDALQAICGFLDGAAANIFWQDPVAQSALVFQSWNEDPEFVERYAKLYVRIDPFFPAMAFIEPGVVFSGGDIIPHEEFRTTRFYKEWAEPQGYIDVIGVNLHRFPSSAACFSVRRSAAQGVVDGEMRRRAVLVAPHVRRAVMIGREIDRQRSMSHKLSTILDFVTAGAFLVDATGRVDFTNETGSALLQDGALLRLQAGALTAVDRSADRAIRAALAATAGGDDISLSSAAPSIVLTTRTGQRFLAHILPLSSGARQNASLGSSATAAIFVRQAEIPVVSGVEAVARSHKLTPGEVRVLQAVGQGGSVREIADALGVSSATVKTHLGSISGGRAHADAPILSGRSRHTETHSDPLRLNMVARWARRRRSKRTLRPAVLRPGRRWAPRR